MPPLTFTELLPALRAIEDMPEPATPALAALLWEASWNRGGPEPTTRKLRNAEARLRPRLDALLEAMAERGYNVEFARSARDLTPMLDAARDFRRRRRSSAPAPHSPTEVVRQALAQELGERVRALQDPKVSDGVAFDSLERSLRAIPEILDRVPPIAPNFVTVFRTAQRLRDLLLVAPGVEVLPTGQDAILAEVVSLHAWVIAVAARIINHARESSDASRLRLVHRALTADPEIQWTTASQESLLRQYWATRKIIEQHPKLLSALDDAPAAFARRAEWWASLSPSPQLPT